MRKLLAAIALTAVSLSGAAMAADLEVAPAAPAYKVAYAPFSWTGFYIGVHGGGDTFSKNWNAPFTPNNLIAGCTTCGGQIGSHTAKSWLAGGQVGFNYQIGWWVGGVEAQISATRLRGSTVGGLPLGLTTFNTDTKSIGTIAARMGIAMDRGMFFVKGGGAWANDTFFTVTPAAPVFTSLTTTRWGWMIGVGGEWAFWDNWSVKVEYDHMEFRRQRATLQPVGAGALAFDYDIEQTVDLIKVGVNYRFGWYGSGPVSARY
jgi:outer membrane immunogenic protein